MLSGLFNCLFLRDKKEVRDGYRIAQAGGYLQKSSAIVVECLADQAPR